MPKLVTVLMPVYNDTRYLSDSISSILDQTLADLELLIVDDGSTNEETREILRVYTALDNRIRVIRNSRNMGLGYSLARGVEETQSEFIARMDADDIAFEARFESQVRVLLDHPHIDILGTQAIEIDENGNELRIRAVPTSHQQIRRTMPFANPMIHPSVMFRRKRILEVGSYDTRLRKVQDYDLWFRCMEKGYQFANLDTPMLYYRTGRSYYRRRSWLYRLQDYRVRREGCRRLKCSCYERLGVLIPLLLGLVPQWLQPYLYFLGRIFDPRVDR